MYLLTGDFGGSEHISVILLCASNHKLQPGKCMNMDTVGTCDCLMQAELPTCSDCVKMLPAALCCSSSTQVPAAMTCSSQGSLLGSAAYKFVSKLQQS